MNDPVPEWSFMGPPVKRLPAQSASERRSSPEDSSMSGPNPGEDGHTDRGWTHAVCVKCWNERFDGQAVGQGMADLESCCYCGAATTDGIYCRARPEVVHGGPAAA